MEGQRPVAGEFYRHFKGHIYQVKTIAKNAEDESEWVVYQGMYPPFLCWIRPLSEFVGEVDGEKYPSLQGQPRFQRIESDQLQNSVADTNPSVDDEMLRKALSMGEPKRYLPESMDEQEIAQRGVMQVLDARSAKEKRQLLVGLKPYLDKRLLHNIAAALDIVLEEADLEEQYDSLLRCLDTMGRFEGGRLR